MIQPNPKKKIVKKKEQDDVNLFTPEETKKRRGLLGLPTSKAEEKAYYEKMRKEGAKNGKTIKKAKSGTSLGMKSVKSGYDNNSGVTRADFVAIGKGTAKSGAKMKMGGKMAKQAAVAIAMKKAGKTPKKMQYGGKAASMVPPMKKGGSVKKAQDGNNVVPRNLNKRQYERVNRINETSRERATKVANRISNRRNARGAENPRMNGDVQFNMKSGGSMKKAMMGTMAAPMMKKGGTIKKAFLGSVLGGVAGKAMLGGMGKKMLGGLAGKALGGLMGKNGKSIKKAGMHKMPDGSMMKNSAMKSGGSMKKCKYGCK